MSSSMVDQVMGARALWRGFTLCGHRDSMRAKRMLWAIPGGEVMSTMELAEQGMMEKLYGPTEAEIRHYCEGCGILPPLAPA